jgi:hypothetical protein
VGYFAQHGTGDSRWGPSKAHVRDLADRGDTDSRSTAQRNHDGHLEALRLAWTKRGIRWDAAAIRAADALIAGNRDPAQVLIRSRDRD